MKAITLTQPWATLVAIGAKHIETRSWSTPYRGTLAIHAAKAFPPDARELCRRGPFDRPLWDAGIRLWTDLPLGAVVATCSLVDCLPIQSGVTPKLATISPDEDGLIRIWHPMHLDHATGSRTEGHWAPETTEHEAEFGDYTPGRYGFVLEDIAAVDPPVPARGSLGLWDWEPPA